MTFERPFDPARKMTMPKPPPLTAVMAQLASEVSDTPAEAVVHPTHYNRGSIEVWDFIVDQGLDFLRGNVIKYVSRAGNKSPEKELEDMKKARFYLDKAIEELAKND